MLQYDNATIRQPLTKSHIISSLLKTRGYFNATILQYNDK